VPDGSSHPFLNKDQIGTDPTSFDWFNSGLIPGPPPESRTVVSQELPPPLSPEQSASLTANIVRGEHDEIVAAARWAEKMAAKALEDAVQNVRHDSKPPTRDSADPLDQVAADWAASVDADEQVIHAFLGIDDPVGREAEELFTEIAVDVELNAFLEGLPADQLAQGELAALSAFDNALASGADAEEALSAAIRAAESGGQPQYGTPPPLPSSLRGTVNDPQGVLSVQSDSELAAPESRGRDPQDTESRQSIEPAPYVAPPPPLVLSGLAGLGIGGTVLADPAFGFGFTFSYDAIPLFRPGAKALSQTERNDPTTETTSETETDNSVPGSSSSELLFGTSQAEVLGAREGNDYVYTDLPTNYDSSVHSIASPLTNPVFSASSGNDIAAAGAGDDSIWGGAGDDQLHGDVPDTGDALYSEFSFPLGLTTSGNDYIDGGAGDDTLYGGGGADELYGGTGDDSIDAGDGVDRLYGGAGADSLFGYAGDDIISGGDGSDTLAGGVGADTFEFAGGSGAGAFDHARSLGTDTISDYSAADNDTFALSDADFGLGNGGTLTDGTDYFETTSVTLSGSAQDFSGGVANAGLVIVGANTGSDGVQVYYTDNAAQMTNLNSYQIADIVSANASDFEAADFLLQT